MADATEAAGKQKEDAAQALADAKEAADKQKEDAAQVLTDAKEGAAKALADAKEAADKQKEDAAQVLTDAKEGAAKALADAKEKADHFTALAEEFTKQIGIKIGATGHGKEQKHHNISAFWWMLGVWMFCGFLALFSFWSLFDLPLPSNLSNLRGGDVASNSGAVLKVGVVQSTLDSGAVLKVGVVQSTLDSGAVLKVGVVQSTLDSGIVLKVGVAQSTLDSGTVLKISVAQSALGAHGGNAAKDANAWWMWLAKRALFVAVLSYGMFFCAKNYLAHRHNAVLSSHRLAALHAYTFLDKHMEDKNADSRALILERVAQSIFDTQDSGFIRGGHFQGSNSLNPFADYIPSKSKDPA